MGALFVPGSVYDRALFLFWNSVTGQRIKTKQKPLICLGGPKDVGGQFLVRKGTKCTLGGGLRGLGQVADSRLSKETPEGEAGLSEAVCSFSAQVAPEPA